MRELLGDLEAFSPEEKDPVRRAQAAMKRPLPKRFYKKAEAVAREDGAFGIALDGRMVRTPAKREFTLPSQFLADLVAAEWEAQETEIDPGRMPLTRTVNSAIDGVAGMMSATRAEIAAYAGSDLVCYRAEAPRELVARQSAEWDPFLAFARDALGATFVTGEGVMHVAQADAAVAAVAARLEAETSPLALSALHVLVTITGSVLMALALADGHSTAEAVWQAAHVDEDWNAEQWGEDAEAANRRAYRRAEFDAAAAILAATR
jgi:Chaperone required for the assembly of the mitochondrial F1-ATPase